MRGSKNETAGTGEVAVMTEGERTVEETGDEVVIAGCEPPSPVP
jgi:hypothetical protein